MKTKRASQQFRRLVDLLGVEQGCHSPEAEGMPPYTPAQIERFLHVCREKSCRPSVFTLTQPLPSREKSILGVSLSWLEGVEDGEEIAQFRSGTPSLPGWQSGVRPLLTIEELLGHKTLVMTMRFANPVPDWKRKAVELLVSMR